MFNPCIDHCYLRYGKQYTSDCDDQCEYAKLAKENQKLKEQLYELEKMDEIQFHRRKCNKNA